MKKVLIITPKFPYPAYGACEQDRAAGIEIFIKNGWEVRVITKIYNQEYQTEVNKQAQILGIKITALNYKYLQTDKIKKWWRRLWSLNWDGAAFEYSDQDTEEILHKELEEFQPDLVWFDYTYLWSLYEIVKQRNIPIVTRSINFEPNHFLDEDGRNLWNYFKAIPKLLSEFIVVRKSDIIFAITPKEAEIYKKLGHKRVLVLPLRGLPNCLSQPHVVCDSKILNIFFAGSTYNVSHNRTALEFLLKEVAPLVEKRLSRQFIFHIFGKKIPSELLCFIDNHRIVYHQYINKIEYESLLKQMDIAIVPSLYGAGMQQKVFEPLARGFPLITSARGLVGYDFLNGKHLILADRAIEYVNALERLCDINLRSSLAAAAKMQANNLFSSLTIEKTIFSNI